MRRRHRPRRLWTLSKQSQSTSLSATSINDNAQAMLDYATAISQLQTAKGMNQTDIASALAEVDKKHKRIGQAAADVKEVADLVIEDFYAAVKKYVSDDVSSSSSAETAAESLGSVRPASEPENSQFWSVAIFGTLAMAAALMATMRVRHGASVIKPSPLLG